MEELLTVDGLLSFLQDRWFVIVAVIIALIIIVTIIKTAVKWALVLALLAGLFFYGSTYTGELSDAVMAKVNDIVASNPEGATYTVDPDGSFTIKTDMNVTLTGKVGSDEVTASYLGFDKTMKVDALLRTFIENVQSNSATQ